MPCLRLADLNAVALGEGHPRVQRLWAFAREIAGDPRAASAGPVLLDINDRIRDGEAWAGGALDAWERQLAAGIGALDAAAVLDKWGEGEDRLSDLGPPVPADAGAWPINIAEGVVLRAHLGRLSAAVEDAYGRVHQGEGGWLMADAEAAFGAIPLWHRLDPGGLDDRPALAARCRDAQIRAADPGLDPAGFEPCLMLADHIEIAAGPLDPDVSRLRLIAGALPADDPRIALARLRRVASDDPAYFLDNEAIELAGSAANWDLEIAADTPAERVPAVLARYRSALDFYAIAPLLQAPVPEGGAWRPSMVDGLVVVAISAQVDGDIAGLGVLDGWRAALAGPDAGDLGWRPERDDLPALAARCRTRLMRWQLGQAPADPSDCIALAETLAFGLGESQPDAVGARMRAVALSLDPGERAEQQAALDAPWAILDGTTDRARRLLAAWGDPDASLYREEYVEYFESDIGEILLAWEQDLAAGLTADHAARAVADRAREWVLTVSKAVLPPFPGDAGAWPTPMAEAVVALIEIGRQLRAPSFVFPLLPALDRILDTPTDDAPALAARCRATQIEAQNGRPAGDIDACEALTALHRLGLGDVHPVVTADRLRMAALHTSQGERVLAERWLAEALAYWVPPPTVTEIEKEPWIRAAALRAWGRALAALARTDDALIRMAEGRALAASAGYERVLDGPRFEAEEALLAVEAGEPALAAARTRGWLRELLATDARFARWRAVLEDEGDNDRTFVEGRALRLAEVDMLATMGQVFLRLGDGALAGEIVEGITGARLPEAAGDGLLDLHLALAFADAPPDAPTLGRSMLASARVGLDEAGLEANPLAVELLAEIAEAEAAADAAAPAKEAARRAVTLQTRLDSRRRPWAALAAAADAARVAGQPTVAIAWAKEAVDAAQQARRDVGALGAAAEQEFLAAHTDVYRTLASLLIEQGRLAEADEALARLGAAELADLTRAAPLTADELMPRTDPERGWRAGLAAAADTLREDEAVARAEAAFGVALDGLEARLAAITPEPTVPDAASVEGLGPTALLQIVLDARQMLLVLTTPAGRTTLRREVGRAEVNTRAWRLYRALRSGGPFAEDAEALYAEIIAPVNAALAAQGVEITTLMVAPDGALRYVPFAALRDRTTGRFAIQDRAIVRYPAVSPDVFYRPSPGRHHVAAFGVQAAGGGLAPLPNVPRELEGIVRRGDDDLDGAIAGTVALDADFTAEALHAALTSETPPPLVHIASHFVFRPGSAADSYLALGGGARLSLEALAGPGYPLGRVELLTLSACQTAVGTFAAGQPIDSFAALALSQGARAVLASLWPVADDSTARLMRAFYGHLADGLSKAEALRRAQLGLMGVEAKGAYRKLGLPDARPTGPHPFAWAPFVLVGDWR